jgi:hypothetical protein
MQMSEIDDPTLDQTKEGREEEKMNDAVCKGT